MIKRDIKFRVWTGALMEYNILAGILGVVYCRGRDDQDKACISPFNTIYDENLPLMQFTGCQDYKDNDIYEGDIVLLDDEEKLSVVFRDGAFVLEDESADYCNLGPVSYCCEVIGNIFEGEYERN